MIGNEKGAPRILGLGFSYKDILFKDQTAARTEPSISMCTCLIEAEYINPRMNTQEGNALQVSLSSFSACMRARNRGSKRDTHTLAT
jgi:hypothetical protein